jgi:hypothetical protein
MAQCVKCGGNTTVRARVGVGSYDYCNRCGPKWTPPYTPERMALARGETLASSEDEPLMDEPVVTRIPAGQGDPCPRCAKSMQRWQHPDDWEPPSGKGFYMAWDECLNGKCPTRQVMPPRFYVRPEAA